MPCFDLIHATITSTGPPLYVRYVQMARKSRLFLRLSFFRQSHNTHGLQSMIRVNGSHTPAATFCCHAVFRVREIRHTPLRNQTCGTVLPRLQFDLGLKHNSFQQIETLLKPDV